MSREIRLESGAYILFAGARKIPCLSAPIERIVLPARDKAPELPLRPSRRWRLSVARLALRIPFSHKDSANLVGDSRPRVTGHVAQREGNHLAAQQARQLAVRVDRPGDSISTRVAWRVGQVSSE